MNFVESSAFHLYCTVLTCRKDAGYHHVLLLISSSQGPRTINRVRQRSLLYFNSSWWIHVLLFAKKCTAEFAWPHIKF